MKAVILAAGMGKRMLPLTLTTPKPMILVAGKPILEHVIDALPPEISEVIIVIGYKGDMIKEHFGELYEGRLITYVEQGEAKGTHHALSQAKDLLDGKFMMLNSDDIHGSEALSEAITHEYALIVSRHEDPTKFGVVIKNEDGTLHDIIEKPETFDHNIVSTGAYILDEKVFQYSVQPAGNGEIYLNGAVQQLAAEFPVQIIEQSLWIPVGYPENIPEAEAILKAREEEKQKEQSEEGTDKQTVDSLATAPVI
jgi:NDP-sugar pyrophosphorylase family protein